MSGCRRASLQQSYDRVQQEVRKRNHPEQETKREQGAPEGTSAETKNKSCHPPHYKRQHVCRKLHIGGQRNQSPSHQHSRQNSQNQQDRTSADTQSGGWFGRFPIEKNQGHANRENQQYMRILLVVQCQGE